MNELLDLVQIWIRAVDWSAVRSLDARALAQSPALQRIALVAGTLAALWLARRLPGWRRARLRRRRTRDLRRALRGRPCPVPLRGALEPYVQPDCASADPERADAPDRFVAREPAFDALDRFTAEDTSAGRLMLFAGSGMGKTALLLQYLAQLPADRRAETELLFLSEGSPEKPIDAIEAPETKTLLLDAFDEDAGALGRGPERLRELLKHCRAFRRVVISSAPDLFRSADSTPENTVAALGVDAIYLCPLTPEQALEYVESRVRGRKRRAHALQILRGAPQLTSRPVVLQHLQHGLAGAGAPRSGFELYQRLVQHWLARELLPGLPVPERDALQEPLRKWVRELALDLYLGRPERGSEAAPWERVQQLADRWKIPLSSCALGGRSLLMRDPRGHVRFSHRSILEFLYVDAVLALPGGGRPADPWSDAMKKFLLPQLGPELDLRRADLSRQSLARRDLRGCNLREVNLRGADLRGADLRGADLRQADLRGARTEHARVRDADLRGVIRDAPGGAPEPTRHEA